ncbi:Twin-arginine translocation protein TatB [hydrothermal vent metagenome]|uniref:Twin-arginine translocation protein TatB n=1 Tax=hydrothermal vent metagenome TaxID=652676 RepID=A0A3B1BBY5_9ZZZZ
MFDVGFWELGLIALVALLVVGPERLPGLARTLGLWLGKGRRTINNIKEEIDREIKIDEIKKSAQVLQENVRNPVGQVMGESADDLRTLKQDTEKMMDDSKSEFEGKNKKNKKNSQEASPDKTHDNS